MNTKQALKSEAASLPNLQRSEEYKRRSEKVIPGYCSCYSRAPMSYVQGVAPAYVEKAEGCHVTDVDGNTYLDFTMGLCPVTLGYAFGETNKSIAKHMQQGIIFNLAHRAEVELAEKLVELIPCAEKVRFGKNGADATTAAVRVSRAYTGRDMVAICGYHGWQDWYVGTTDQNRGVPQAVRDLSLKFAYNDIDSLQDLFDRHPGRIACVIMEPMSVVWPREGFLEQVKDTTRKNGAILVFDEIVTGFRWSLGGAQEYFGVIPDLACFSKGLANGLPISALVGRTEIMDYFRIGQAFWSTTYGNEALSMCVALDTLAFYQENDVVGHMWRQGQKLMDGFNDLIAKHGLQDTLSLSGAPPRHVFNFAGDPDMVLKSLFQQECLLRGLMTLWCHNLSWAHQDKHLAQALGIYDEVLAVLKAALTAGDVRDRLMGEPVQPVFRRM